MLTPDQLSDYHHDTLNPSRIPPSTIIKRANTIWARRGIRPKQHLSEPRPGAVTLMERRAHADRCESLPAELPDDMGKFSYAVYCYFVKRVGDYRFNG
jgi:UV DNA damage endonuclease